MSDMTPMTGSLEGIGTLTRSKYELQLSGILNNAGVEYGTTLEGEMLTTVNRAGMFRLTCMEDLLVAKFVVSVDRGMGHGAYQVIQSTGCFSGVTGGPIEIEFGYFKGDNCDLKFTLPSGPSKIFDFQANSMRLTPPNFNWDSEFDLSRI